MKRQFGIVVIVVGLIAASAIIFHKYSSKAEELEREMDLARIHKDYLERVGDLETVVVKGESADESAQRTHVVLKSMGRVTEKEQ